MTDAEEKLKIKEEWLRKEIRAARALSFTLIQWGVTVLAAVESSFYYLRSAITTHLVSTGTIQKGGLMPWPRWFAATMFLAFIAFIFSRHITYLTEKVVNYRSQLIAMNGGYSGIIEVHPAKTKLSKLAHYLLYGFPAFDAALYFAFSLVSYFRVSI